MACSSERQIGAADDADNNNDDDNNETLQELARKLPEGDALPDGFSECPPEVDNASRPEPQLSSEESKGAISEALQESSLNPYSFSEISISSSGSSDLSAGFNNGSPRSSPSRKTDRRERLRSFPVELSAADSFEDERADGTILQNEMSKTSKDGGLPVATDNSECMEKFTDGAGETETRAGKIEEQEEDASEIDQLIHGTAIPDNGIQTVEGLHSSLLEDEIAELRKQNEQLIQERLTTNAQLTRSLLVREKLESLCRELQRHNKQLTDECKRIASEEQQKRLDLSTRFHDAIKDVTAKLEEQGDERVRQIKQNEMLQDKLRQFTQQYELQEQQYSEQLKTKLLEQQLLEVKLKQQEELNKQAEANLQIYTEQISQLLRTEQDLRGRLALYGEKFEQFQETLTKSNEVFASFKTQMDKMSKTIKKLEKENFALQKKCEKSDVSLIELVDERANLKKQLETTKNQKEKLEALCRILQAERKQQNMAMASVAASAAASGAISAAAALRTEQIEPAEEDDRDRKIG